MAFTYCQNFKVIFGLPLVVIDIIQKATDLDRRRESRGGILAKRINAQWHLEIDPRKTIELFLGKNTNLLFVLAAL